MTNSILVLTVLSTNWLPITLNRPNGDGTLSPVTKEVGMVVSNRSARVVADGRTNVILLSSEAVPPAQFLIRDQMPQIHYLTNALFGKPQTFTIPLPIYP